MRQKPDWCGPRQAAKRLGISVDEVLDLISTGELSALTFMGDDRWLIDLDDLDRVARTTRRQDARPMERPGIRPASCSSFGAAWTPSSRA